MDVDRVSRTLLLSYYQCVKCLSNSQEIDEQNETGDDTSNIIDSSVIDDEDDSVCSIVMSTTDENNNSVSLDDTSDLMKNYALMLEVPTALSTPNGQL